MCSVFESGQAISVHRVIPNQVLGATKLWPRQNHDAQHTQFAICEYLERPSNTLRPWFMTAIRVTLLHFAEEV